MPWFKTVLRAARVALFTLGLLDAEARASRLSFADVVRRIADQPDTAPAFLSKKVQDGWCSGSEYEQRVVITSIPLPVEPS